MFKFGSSVLTGAIRPAFLIVSLVLLSDLTVTTASSQGGATQTEEQKQAREALNQGVHSFKNGQYEEAINEFQRAK